MRQLRFEFKIYFEKSTIGDKNILKSFHYLSPSFFLVTEADVRIVQTLEQIELYNCNRENDSFKSAYDRHEKKGEPEVLFCNTFVNSVQPLLQRSHVRLSQYRPEHRNERGQINPSPSHLLPIVLARSNPIAE